MEVALGVVGGVELAGGERTLVARRFLLCRRVEVRRMEMSKEGLPTLSRCSAAVKIPWMPFRLGHGASLTDHPPLFKEKMLSGVPWSST